MFKFETPQPKVERPSLPMEKLAQELQALSPEDQAGFAEVTRKLNAFLLQERDSL